MYAVVLLLGSNDGSLQKSDKKTVMQSHDQSGISARTLLNNRSNIKNSMIIYNINRGNAFLDIDYKAATDEIELCFKEWLNLQPKKKSYEEDKIRAGFDEVKVKGVLASHNWFLKPEEKH